MGSIAMLAPVVAVMATVATAATVCNGSFSDMACFSPKLTHTPSFAKGAIRVSSQKLTGTKFGLPKPNALR